MAEATPSILIQYVIVQRDQVPTGWRVLIDGRYECTAADNALPTPTEPLDRDRVLTWQTEGSISADQVHIVEAAIRDSGFLDLQPKLLINYCKDDPGVAIWVATVDGQQKRVVVYDPKPKRAAEIDKLRAVLAELIGS
jgi:hypothetical protein